MKKANMLFWVSLMVFSELYVTTQTETRGILLHGLITIFGGREDQCLSLNTATKSRLNNAFYIQSPVKLD